MKYSFKIKGIDCANCAAKLENEIKKIEGIDLATINFFSERLTIECNEDIKEEVMAKVNKIIKKEEPDCTLNQL